MFNRRKPDDRATNKPEPASPAKADPLQGQVTPAGPLSAPTDPAQLPRNETPRPAPPELGVGVPTFIPLLPKEPAMARSPFSTTPTPQPSPGGMGVGMSSGQNQTSPLSMPPGPGSAPVRPGMNPGMGGGPAPRPAERRTLVVGRGISVQGTVTEAERLVVEGTVEASMIHAAELSIALGGVFRGEVEVEEAEIAGIIDGTLLARGSLIVRATGKVLGTARCRRLQVEDGGQITGRIEMLSDAEAKPASEAPRPALLTPPV